MKNPYKLTRLPAIADAANALAQQAVLAQAALDFARVEPNGDVFVPEGGEVHLRVIHELFDELARLAV
jgi:hypothetical protein